jgi:hypothetical protein
VSSCKAFSVDCNRSSRKHKAGWDPTRLIWSRSHSHKFLALKPSSWGSSRTHHWKDLCNGNASGNFEFCVACVTG